MDRAIHSELGDDMSRIARIARILSYLHTEPGSDQAFESYYSTLTRVHPEFAPNANDARRDFERASRSMSRIVYY